MYTERKDKHFSSTIALYDIASNFVFVLFVCLIFFWSGGVGGMARQDHFTHFEPSPS